MEILAPAGSADSLAAAVRAGADAVYLGARRFSARAGAANFAPDELREAAAHCRERGVKLYQTLNTIVFDEELGAMREVLELACEAGVDGLLVQDLAVATLARRAAPSLPLHASTQMSVHSVDGAKLLEELGFSRVVLARELSLKEIEAIARGTSIELECFVHGALCMCVSGQCAMSAMIGSRSGNRGMCAQPCRLPFTTPGSAHALSLRDMSHIPHLADLAAAGVSALKIEGRLKRPEYVAAAVSACRTAREGGQPDYGPLEAVFSRSGFTDGYLTGNRGGGMFGTRQREDVAAADSALLRSLRGLYKDERQTVPVDFSLRAAAGEEAVLRARDRDGNGVAVEGDVPQAALAKPTDPGRAGAALRKTGGTPYRVEAVEVEIEPGLMIPAAELNAMRREALERLAAARRAPRPHPFSTGEADRVLERSSGQHTPPERPALRVRFGRAEQLDEAVCAAAELVILPAGEFARADGAQLGRLADKLAVELPRACFSGRSRLRKQLARVRESGVSRALAGTLDAVSLARECGFAVHGDFGLNLVNTPALARAAELGLRDATLSVELLLVAAKALGGALPRGVLAYGHLPLMLTRNCPVGSHLPGGCKGCKREFPDIVDRKGERFFVDCAHGAAVLHNCVPLRLSDRLEHLRGLDFITLYFTRESRADCRAVLAEYQTGAKPGGRYTRGLYYRGVL